MTKKTKTKRAPQPTTMEFYDKRRLAEMFNVSTKTVDRMFHSGLPSIKIGKRRYVTRAQLQDYVAKNAESA